MYYTNWHEKEFVTDTEKLLFLNNDSLNDSKIYYKFKTGESIFRLYLIPDVQNFFAPFHPYQKLKTDHLMLLYRYGRARMCTVAIQRTILYHAYTYAYIYALGPIIQILNV